jgi:hypothetical protein
MELTRDLIFDILHPKLLVCFSVNDVFDKLIGSIRKKEGLIEKSSVKKFKPYHIKHTCAITQVNGTISEYAQQKWCRRLSHYLECRNIKH